MTLDTFSTALEMIEARKSGAISAVELLDLHLERVIEVNPALNAIVSLQADVARAEAALIDRQGASADNRQLHGLPVTVKETIFVRNLPITAGLQERATAKAARDALVVQRIRESQGIILGKTNCPARSRGFQSANPIYGRTNNPWDLSRSPGGSSGGGGAAVAAGLIPLDLGTDSGGSIRYPASFCGVYGHKPSDGLVPNDGRVSDWDLVTGTKDGEAGDSSVTLKDGLIGPLARDASDLELALDIIAGPLVRDAVAWQVRLPPPRHDRLSKFRVGILHRPDWLPIDAEIEESIERVADALRSAGADLIDRQPDGFGDLRDLHRLKVQLSGALEGRGRSVEERTMLAQGMRSKGDEFHSLRANGVEASASDYFRWVQHRRRYQRALDDYFRSCDVLVAPVAHVQPLPHSVEDYWDETLSSLDTQTTVDVDGRELSYWVQGVYTELANLTGRPATSFPVGLSRMGLPIGLQVIGPFLEDRTPITFAKLLGQEIGGYQKPPQPSISRSIEYAIEVPAAGTVIEAS